MLRRLWIILLLTGGIAIAADEKPLERNNTEPIIIKQEEPACVEDIPDSLLALLHPIFRHKVQKLLDSCKSRGIRLKVIETYRTYSRQDMLYKKGKKFTRLRGGLSAHQHGLGLDLVPVIGYKAQWHNKLLWKRVGHIGESLGLTWGGRWKRPYDPGHFELRMNEQDLCNYPNNTTELERLSEVWLKIETLTITE